MTLLKRILVGGLLAGAFLLGARAADAQAIPGQWVFMYDAPLHLTAAGTTTISAAGMVHTVCVNTAAASSTVTIKDGTTVIAIIDSSTKGCYTYDSQFLTSLVVVVAAGSPDVTVTYES